jgi:zinc protease
MHAPNWSRPALLTALVLGLGFTTHAFAQGSAMNGIIPYPTQVETLDNGLTVILMPMPANGLVAYWSLVRTGSRDEYEAGHTGFAHFFEHMMFRGTKKYPSERYQGILTSIGADANAYTTDDLTAYHLSFAAADLETVMELESDRFQNLDYSEEGFKTEAGAVYGEYRKNRTSPFFTLYEALMGTAFKVHTYGHTTLGFEKDIAAMPSMYEYSRPENTILFVVGDIEPQSVMALARKYYGAWPRGYVAPQIPAEPPQEAERHIEVSYAGRTLPILWIAYKIDRFDPENRARVAMDLLAELAFGPTSELYKRLVLDEQVVEFLVADPGMNRDPGLLDIYTRVKDPAKVDYVRGAIDETIAQYRSTLVDPRRLEALKSRLRYDFLLGLDTPDKVAGRLARPIAISGSLTAVDALYRAYDSVAAEEIRATALGYMVPERRTVAVLRERE